MPAETFSEWFESKKFNHFGPGEFESYFARERNGVKNNPPPKRLWKNIVPALRMVDELRASFGKPCRILSSYRAPAYNKAVGGAPLSQHKEFTALDITIDGISPQRVYDRLIEWRKAGKFTGGLGLYLFNDYSTPEAFEAWKATGYARPLGEVARLENIAFVAGMLGDWPAITAMDRSNFTYNVFGYELYAKWAKAQAVGKTIQENYAFVQNELVNVGLTGTPGSLVICQHLNALSTMMFNMMRQGAALQNP